MDTTGLAKLICKVMYSGTATEAPTQTYLEAEVTLLTFRQGRRQTTSKYIGAIESKIEIFEQLGRKPSMSSQGINN